LAFDFPSSAFREPAGAGVTGFDVVELPEQPVTRPIAKMNPAVNQDRRCMATPVLLANE
jgi:hypothetical protein